MPTSTRHYARRMRPVHFVFRSHIKGEPFSFPAPDRKTYLYEEVLGISLFPSITPEVNAKEGFNRATVRSRSWKKVFEKMRNRGLVTPGESSKGFLSSVKSFYHLSKLFFDTGSSYTTAVSTFKINDIKKSFVLDARYAQARHSLIRATIRRVPTPLHSEYGTAHSLLSAELAHEGIKSSRYISPRVFNFYARLIRKLIRGTNPNTIPNVEYKRALIANLFGLVPDTRRLELVTDAEVRLESLVSTALLEDLPEKELDAFFRHAKVSDRNAYHFLLKVNGLPIKISIPELVDWVRTKRQFYSRLLASPEMEKTIKIIGRERL